MSGQIFLEASEISVSEIDGRANVAIARTGDLSQAVTVQFATTPDTAGAADYVDVAGTVTLAAGQARAVVPVTILDDSSGEPTESLVFSIINVDSGTLTFPRTRASTFSTTRTPSPIPSIRRWYRPTRSPRLRSSTG